VAVVGLALAVAPSLAMAARAQQTSGTAAVKKTDHASPDSEAARQKAAARILALGVGLDWRKLSLADLEQIEKDLKAPADAPDARTRVIVAARLRELNVNVDWRRFTSRQLADLYVTALGVGKSHAAPDDTLPAPAVPTATATEEPPAAPATEPYVYDGGATGALPASSVYYTTPQVVYYSTPPVYYGAPYYPATYFIPPSYADNHHGTTCVFPPAPRPFRPECRPGPNHFNQTNSYAYATGVSRGAYGRPARIGSFVPNGRGGSIVPAPQTRSVPSFTPRPIVPAITRPVTMPAAPQATFGSFSRMGNIGFGGRHR
jgi:hypothetical protein